MKHKTKFVAIAGGLIAIAIYSSCAIVDMYAKSATKNVAFQVVNARGIPDGVYNGSYEIVPVKVGIQVTIKNEAIVNITILEHQNGRGSKAEMIVNDVIKNQRLEVVAVSGATVSSKTILKAVENALLGN
ncbi:FMN-binding protein [Spirochaetia bacterium]|nr:FMN-binding protein [Spirochaetia bacterium]